ncbi:Uma2 family endonuclease [Gemmata sp. JC673]|uniref:Uma2 family endonuclease n=1 Tax=Gemmata algarum TaxID=2975278 RepID=A0ABU5F7W2_9BACT|nr:Uma2 family endonuclease [Gemmata algarum]MDY3562872.1 Uma2 family endonuclease [Gemmata algarum]
MTAMPPPAPSRRPFRFTREQYFELGQRGFFNGKRVELLYGEITEMSPANWPHHVSVGLVTDALLVAFAVGFFVDTQQPFPIPNEPLGSAPEPDVAVIPGRRRDYTDHPTTAALLVEVSDTTLAEDLTTKAELYATANVPEYWVLDIPNRQLYVHRDPQPLPAGLGATAYRTRLVLTPADTVQPLAAPPAVVRVSDLFQ